MEVREMDDSFLRNLSCAVLLDVRSPGEYARGHIPRAVSFPLFTDSERAEVGTLFIEKGKRAALLRGLEQVGPQMADFVRQAETLAPQGKLAIHCWRGGMRSASLGWLLETAGFDVLGIKGGYKAYRSYIHQRFADTAWPLLVLGGETGSGKTAVLHALAKAGEQVIDLEHLARHKGSAFGSLGEEPQPTPEQFENNLYHELCHMDSQRRIWVENESRAIGRVFQPSGFWEQFRKGIYVGMEVPYAVRLRSLAAVYGCFPKPDLIDAFLRIQKRLGGQHVQAAIANLEAGHMEAAAAIALGYYDKSYAMSHLKCAFSRILRFIPNPEASVMEQARELIRFADENKL